MCFWSILTVGTFPGYRANSRLKFAPFGKATVRPADQSNGANFSLEFARQPGRVPMVKINKKILITPTF